MTIVVNANADPSVVREALKGQKGKKLDAFKHCGTVKFEEDAQVIQKRMRNGWGRRTA